MTNNHEFFGDRIQAWLSGQLDKESSARFEDHMENCPACAATLASAKELWELLGRGDVLASGPIPSVWPEVRDRTLGQRKGGAWFFGGGRLMRASLAGCAVAAGLMAGVMVPGLSGNANADDTGNYLWISEASWLDDSATDGLAGIWLDPGLAAESDGS